MRLEECLLLLFAVVHHSLVLIVHTCFDFLSDGPFFNSTRLYR